MRDYELMVIIRPEVEVTEKSAREIVEKMVNKMTATITSLTIWGKRQLAYPIEKASEGTYVLVTLQALSLKSDVLEKETRMGSAVLRFLLTVK
ncbi:MAG: 30S ribosomal protein S6 [Patescibacteria group bacterium]